MEFGVQTVAERMGGRAFRSLVEFRVTRNPMLADRVCSDFKHNLFRKGGPGVILVRIIAGKQDVPRILMGGV